MIFLMKPDILSEIFSSGTIFWFAIGGVVLYLFYLGLKEIGINIF